jgi:hypothetical protein
MEEILGGVGALGALNFSSLLSSEICGQAVRYIINKNSEQTFTALKMQTTDLLGYIAVQFGAVSPSARGSRSGLIKFKCCLVRGQTADVASLRMSYEIPSDVTDMATMRNYEVYY